MTVGRTLAGCLAIGLALLGARRVVIGPEPSAAPVLRVEVAAAASEAEVEGAVDEAVLLAFAERAGWAKRDPVVRDRLVRNLAFVEAEAAGERVPDDDALLARALGMRMHELDPLARARLVWLAREVVARLTRSAPSEAELASYLAAHPDRFARAAALDFVQVFLSAEQRRLHLDDDADAVRDVLAGVPPDAAGAFGDASLLPREVHGASPRRIDTLFGAGFAEKLFALEPGAWRGPVRSAFGLHFVWVRERSAATVPPLAAVRAQVEHGYQHDARAERVGEAVRRMRAAYDVEVVRLP